MAIHCSSPSIPGACAISGFIAHFETVFQFRIDNIREMIQIRFIFTNVMDLQGFRFVLVH